MPESGLLVLDKPSGPTSYDCVRHVKRILQGVRVGHCGTLDPLARGVLLLLIGSSTRQQDQFMGLEKQYWFRAEWGWLSETGDRQGRRLRTFPAEPIARDRLETVAKGFVGELWQTPPRVSALKYKGKPLYAWAREGVEVPRPTRKIRITSFEILSADNAFWEARVVCSRGTYIRSLVEDVAEQLGTGAVVAELIRERVGSYTREGALRWNQVCSSDRRQLLSWAQSASL